MTRSAHTTPAFGRRRHGAAYLSVLAYSVRSGSVVRRRVLREGADRADQGLRAHRGAARRPLHSMCRPGIFFRILSVEGPQVGDLNLWKRRTTSASASTAGKNAGRCTRRISPTGDRPVEHLPEPAPRWRASPTTRSTGTAGTRDGRRGARTSSARACDPYTNLLLKGVEYHHCCHSNLNARPRGRRATCRPRRPSFHGPRT